MAGAVRRHSRRHELIHEMLDVMLKFLVQLAVDLGAAHERTNAQAKLLDHTHGALTEA